MLFGGIKGFNLFNPDSIINENKKLPLFLTGLRVNNKPIQEQLQYIQATLADKVTAIQLPYSQALVGLDFITPYYAANDKVKYALLSGGMG